MGGRVALHGLLIIRLVIIRAAGKFAPNRKSAENEFRGIASNLHSTLLSEVALAFVRFVREVGQRACASSKSLAHKPMGWDMGLE